MYIHRELERKIYKYLNSPEILCIIGSRQAGKTTLIKKIFTELEKAVYLDFEDKEILNVFNTDIKLFCSLYVKGNNYLFIDEFQYAKEGGKSLKYLYDNDKIKIIISGSSSPDLTHQAIKYLVGRVFIFNLYPFNFSEYLSYKDADLYNNVFSKLKNQIDEYMFLKKDTLSIDISPTLIEKLLKYYYDYTVYGGYPRVVISKDSEEKEEVLKNIYNTFFLREIRDILQITSEDKLEKMLKALALQVSNMVIYNELSQITDTNYRKVQEYLSILEKTFIIKKITPFCKNKRTEISKSPKIYFIDNGFRNMTISNFHTIQQRVDRGALNENFAARELITKQQNIKYWRTKSDAEIDFVIEDADNTIAIEVKSSLKSPKIGKSTYSFMDKYNSKRTVFLSESYFKYVKEKELLFLPLFFI